MGVAPAELYPRNIVKTVLPYQTRRWLTYHFETVRRIIETREFGLFGALQIEINTNCNRRCNYCPNSVSPKIPELMKPGLYHQIVDELREMKFRGRIMPHCMSEPLLHPELPQLIADAREVEKAKIVIYTNGDFLDQERFDELKRAGVNTLIITQHGKQAPRPLLDLLDNVKQERQVDIIYQDLRYSRLFNRGIPDLIDPDRRAIPNPCWIANCYPQILVNGNVTQCCNDFKGENVFGNVNKRSIMEIWNDPQFRAFRKEVSQGQFNTAVCQRCVFNQLIVP